MGLRLKLAWFWFRFNLKHNTHWGSLEPRLWKKDLWWAIKTQYLILFRWKTNDKRADGQFFKTFSPWKYWELEEEGYYEKNI